MLRLLDGGVLRSGEARRLAALTPGLQEVYGEWRRDKARLQAQELFRRYPEARLVWSGNDEMALGAMQAWQRSAGEKVRRHMARTPATGARGTVSAEVVVTVDPSGATRARLSRGSGDARVDAALGRQAARMPRLGAPPDGRPFQATLPVTIRMR